MLKYFIKTYGCQMNESDSERIAAVLKNIGYKKAPDIQNADLIIFNMCAVRQTAVDRAYGQLKNIKKLKIKNKKLKVFLTGCILDCDKKKLLEKVDQIFDIRDLKQLCLCEELSNISACKLRGKRNATKQSRYSSKVLKQQDCFVAPLSLRSFSSSQKHSVNKQNNNHYNYLKINPKYKHKKSAFIPIMTGCNNFCSYCAVPYTRGREYSRPAEDILREIRALVKNRYKEITLLGQNVNSYKSRKLKILNFSNLLKMINDIKGDFKINFLTSHPKDMSDDLIKTIVECEKISKNLHLPFQSGSNTILKKMNRGYSRQYYLNLVKKIKKVIPEIKFSTDVIVGFPGETKKQFEKTVKVIKKVGFYLIYANKYSPRKEALAAKIYKDDISLDEKKWRWKIINNFNKKNMLKKNKNKIITILGPTATGKTKLAIKLAYKFNGEIVSADSRQVYKGMDVGTGKDLKDYQISRKSKTANKNYELIKIPYHLIDVVSPKTEFNLAKYQKLAYKAIDDILSRGKLPFLVGGSGLYLQAIIDGYNLSSIKPNKKLRMELEKLSADELFKCLRKINADFANKLNNSDQKNSRRLIRCIESIKQNKDEQFKKNRISEPKYSTLILGLTLPKNELNKKIDQRMEKWFGQENLLGEIENLRNQGVGWKRLNEFGLEYRWASSYLCGKIEFQKMKQFLFKDLKKFAKRQMTWFYRWEKQGAKIHWIKNKTETKKLIKKFVQ